MKGSGRVETAQRLRALPPYLFAELDRRKAALRAKGVDIIDLGVGDPDLPTPKRIVERMREEVLNPRSHRYPSYEGLRDFREAVSRWYERRFGVMLDPDGEVLALIGSKEGIAHIPLAFINPGAYSLVPSPGYPVYHAGTVFAGGRSFFLPLVEEQGFLPDLGQVPQEVAELATLLFINYPNNPTAAVADTAFFTEVVEFARRHRLIVCHDAAYSEISYDGYTPPSFLEVDGAKEVGVEFHSLSKTYNMTGWRLGFAVGNREVLAGLGKTKTNIDSGVFQAVQWAGIEALKGDQSDVEQMRATYQGRRDVMVRGIRAVGLEVTPPRATFYLWVKVPPRHDSVSFASLVLNEAGVVLTPGSGFGEAGEGYVRLALTVPEARLEEAIERLQRISL
ncbi:MAG: LL-diaminopimelate aminotransferase [Deltaproteobacteria bacterium RBG_13_52_11]|nr:MAG: LL-diaminopimelate aminotransferase [Deltaproteobacteria bacterium RBG_13_52_11]